jgi:hypothetical protein
VEKKHSVGIFTVELKPVLDGIPEKPHREV